MNNSMIKFFNPKALFTIIALFLLNASIVQAQEKKAEFPTDIFFEVACFEALQPGTSKMFIELGKPFHEEMIRQGLLVDWSFHRVDYPNGDDCECDYREVRVFKGLAALDKINSDETGMKIAKKLWPDMDMQETMKKFRETAKFKGSRIYHLMDAAAPGPTDGKMAVMNFMDVKPGMSEDYVSMEKTVFKPVHKASLAAGDSRDWILAQSILPYGTDFTTDFITVDVYDSYEQMARANGKMMETVNKVHPGKDVDALWDKMDGIRSLTHAEIMVKVTEAEVDPPAPEATSSTNK